MYIKSYKPLVGYFLMKRFDHVSPLSYRYLPKDGELCRTLESYSELEILPKIKRTVPEIVVPRLHLLERKIIAFYDEYSSRVIPRRVDGEHVGKISVFELFSGYANRLERITKTIKRLKLNFGELEEATRNDRIFELVCYLSAAFSIEASIANDIRHHFRSEIGEFGFRDFDPRRVGSSTMPHKRNPVEFENVVSLWKVYASPTLASASLAQITEHQGDSTNEFLPYSVFELAIALSFVTKEMENNLGDLRLEV